jgi:hypothetical protein
MDAPGSEGSGNLASQKTAFMGELQGVYDLDHESAEKSKMAPVIGDHDPGTQQARDFCDVRVVYDTGKSAPPPARQKRIVRKGEQPDVAGGLPELPIEDGKSDLLAQRVLP